MKRLVSLAAALALTLTLCVSAAAARAEIIRAFVHGGALYTYVTIDGADQPITRAEAKIGAQTFPAGGRLETVRQAGSPVTYLLLVDNSTSMPAFRQETEEFASALAQAGGERTRFILATFGGEFAIVRENVPAEELAEVLAAVPFNERATRLHYAIDQSLQYFSGLPREGDELRCLVVLSDAIQYDPDGGIPYEELLEKVEASGVMLHSVGLGADQDSLDSLGRLAEASGGLHQVVGPELTGEEAGTALAESGGGLFVTSFDLSGADLSGVQRVSVTFAAGGELLCRAETEADLSGGTVSEPPEAGGGEPETDAEHPEAPGGEEAPGGKEEKPALPENPAPAANPSSGAPVPSASFDTGGGTGWAIWAAVAASAVVLLAAVFLLVRRKKAAKDAPLPAPEPVPAEPPERDCAAPRGIFVRLDVLTGAQAGETRELELFDQLIAGRDPGCDIVFPDEALAPRNTRIFLRNGAVWAEDLGSPQGTAVGGVLLEDARALRSGDVISIGDLRFQLRF